MNSREEILNKVRAAQKDPQAVGDWDFPADTADLERKFTEALIDVKGETVAVKNLEAFWSTLGSLITELNATRGVYNLDPPLGQTLLKTRIPEVEWREAVGDHESIRRSCLEADVGLTVAPFALAETGTIGVTSGNKHSRLVSLLPEVHIALLPRDRLLPDLIAWERVRPRRLPAQLVLVSGPSKTADIEQTLVVGAHGPKRFIVLIYDS
jgi:L-lactate dehydrogenase complex protein LldG